MSQAPSEASDSPSTVVVFGGSFDPPHIAHAMAVLFALSTLPEARVLVVPTFEHALGKSFSASFDDRMQMCARAMIDLPRTEVCDIEREIGSTSRTFHTLKAIKKRHPHTQLRLLVGADILAERDQWYRFDEVMQLAPPLVVGRPGYASSAQIELPSIASTSLRAELAKGKRPEGRIAKRVLDWIEEQRLYRQEGG